MGRRRVAEVTGTAMPGHAAHCTASGLAQVPALTQAASLCHAGARL